MKTFYRSFLASAALSMIRLLSGNATAFQASKQSAKTAAKTPAMAAPSEKECRRPQQGHGVGEYQYQGLPQGRPILRQTKEGKFMTEADAQKAGYRAAKESAAKKKPPQVKK